MNRLMDWFRDLFTTTDAEEQEAVEARLRKQADRLRLARIDAGLPVERRKQTSTSASHPHRRWTDG